MPKLVCVNCQTELRCEHSGTSVLEIASFGVYKVWDADTYKCPGCEFEIVSGFGDSPIRADHYKEDFPDWLENFKSHTTRIEYDYERPQSRKGNLK